jgi:hypothetical protein
MSGIYTRKKYDDSYYPMVKNMTEGNGQHVISSERIYNNYCINNNVPINSRTAFMSNMDYKNMDHLIDLESHLKNLDIPLSNQIEGRTINERNEISNKISKNIIKNNCNDNDYLDINTRLENPPILVRGITTSRFDYPIVPHTSYYYDGYKNTLQTGNNRSGINTRLIAKDIAKEKMTKDNKICN